jgi:hypothetical protein
MTTTGDELLDDKEEDDFDNVIGHRHHCNSELQR